MCLDSIAVCSGVGCVVCVWTLSCVFGAAGAAGQSSSNKALFCISDLTMDLTTVLTTFYSACRATEGAGAAGAAGAHVVKVLKFRKKGRA